MFIFQQIIESARLTLFQNGNAGTFQHGRFWPVRPVSREYCSQSCDLQCDKRMWVVLFSVCEPKTENTILQQHTKDVLDVWNSVA